jgi:hypothetical protein
MTYGDRKFMLDVGIEPCILDDPFPSSLPPPLPPAPAPSRITDSLPDGEGCMLALESRGHVGA